MEIKLTKGFMTIVDREDFERFSEFNWYVISNGSGNLYASRKGRKHGRRVEILMHRAILDPPPQMGIDHIDGDGLNNRRNNLRIATPTENMRNRRHWSKNKSSLYKGVTWNKQMQKWQAAIVINRKQMYLGQFYDEIEAALTYDAAAIKYFGAFAATNFHGGKSNDTGSSTKSQ